MTFSTLTLLPKVSHRLRIMYLPTSYKKMSANNMLITGDNRAITITKRLNLKYIYRYVDLNVCTITYTGGICEYNWDPFDLDVNYHVCTDNIVDRQYMRVLQIILFMNGFF